MNTNNDTGINVNVGMDKSLYNQASKGATTSISTPDDTDTTGMSGITTQNATTVFVDDNAVDLTDESHVTHISKAILNINDTQVVQQSLIDFLAKPIVLTSGTFSSSDTFSLFNSTSMPRGAFISSQGAMWLDKLRGIFGIRMDMRFRLVINANRFQQGRYCLGWVPLAGMTATTSQLKATKVVQGHCGTLVQRSTIPHVEIDLCTGTSAELLVPFVSVHNFFDLQYIATADTNTLGYLNIYPYQPLVAATGNLTATYTLYVSFENVTLFGAASPQSGLIGTSDKEVANKMNGPVSSVALAFHKGFKEFSHIPLLGSYAKQVSWISERIAVAASVFGFSKPTQGDSSTKMMLVNNPSHSNIDGDSDAKAIGLQSKPGVTQIDGLSGSNYDEMDFSYVLRKYAWFKTLSWSTGDIVDASIGLIRVGAFQDIVYSVASTNNYQPLTYVTSLFEVWRGSIKFRFKFVKTEFHSGRISIAFHPGQSVGPTSNPHYVNRVILDIREKTTAEIVIPYISSRMWTDTNDQIGQLSITIVDPLIAPATVAQNINIICEIAGGDDFEVAIPAAIVYSPTTIVPQSGLEDLTLYSEVLGNAGVRSDPLIGTTTSIGEKITSLRSLCKKYTPYLIGPTYDGLDQRTCTMLPDAINAYSSTTDSSDVYVRADMYSYVACCYAIIRGGIRIRDSIGMGLYQPSTIALSKGDTSTITTILTVSQNTAESVSLSGYFSFPYQVNDQIQYQQLGLNNAVSVEIPQYYKVMGRPKGDIILYQAATPTSSTQWLGNYSYARAITFILPKNITDGYVAKTGFHLHNISRSVADDFNCLTFISVPPMVLKNTSTEAGFY